MLLNERVAIITGATSGIGRATLERFVQEQARVVAVGRDRAVLTELDARSDVITVEADVCDAAAPERIVRAATEAFGGIDVLVNAAGIISVSTLEETSDEAWDRMLDINLRAPFRLLRAALPQLVARQGSVVNVSSVAGLRVFPGLAAYCASKAGLDQLTRSAAIELAPRGVRVNAVNPGVVVTNLHLRSGMSAEQYEAFLEHCRQTHPLGRVGDSDEVAELILFLASGRAGWITGETMAIDGGRHLTCAR